ncbi:hypothetical protein [Shewanella colwelliana]|uniref:hypothetical protein n=1 Tax=Shewanella colwelliana TaxID=23 RepID=UPI000491BFE1|nr:hypothetical protein [Shewanella colwelliana]
MAKKNERTILFLDLHLQTKTTTPKITGLTNRFTLDELFNKVKAIREANNVNLVRGSENNKKEIYLADIEQDLVKRCWTLLVNITDTTLADEVHRKIGGDEETRKVNAKENGVGTDFSSHIIIKSDPEPDGSWTVLYEQSTALPIKLVASYLNELFKRVAKSSKDDFEIDHPKNAVDKKGNIKKINTYCHCHFNGHVSDQFRSDLNGGNLKNITLITGEIKSVVGYDAQKHTSIKEVQLPIQIDKDAILKAGGNWKWIDNFRKNDAKDLSMQEIKVSFKDEGDVAHTADIDITTGKLINNDQYLKKVKITDFVEILTTSVDLIHKPIRTKMLEHI